MKKKRKEIVNDDGSITNAKLKKPIYKKPIFLIIFGLILLASLGRFLGGDKAEKTVDGSNQKNFLLNYELQEEDVKSGSGNVIGKRGYINVPKAELYNNLEGNEELAAFIQELFESKIDEKKYNWFNIFFEDGSTFLFTGANWTIIDYVEKPNYQGTTPIDPDAVFIMKDKAFREVEEE